MFYTFVGFICGCVVLNFIRTKILKDHYKDLLSFLDTLEMTEVDIDKLCEFRKNIGFAYPESASEYQEQLACYRQGIEDVLKAQKGEEV